MEIYGVSSFLRSLTTGLGFPFACSLYNSFYVHLVPPRFAVEPAFAEVGENVFRLNLVLIAKGHQLADGLLVEAHEEAIRGAMNSDVGDIGNLVVLPGLDLPAEIIDFTHPVAVPGFAPAVFVGGEFLAQRLAARAEVSFYICGGLRTWARICCKAERANPRG